MSKPAGTCAFCGERRKLTKSHIWPEYASKIVPSTATFYDTTIGRVETFEQIVPGPAFYEKTKPGHAGTRRPKNTCQVCNGGWMNTIENSAKPAVSRLLLGEPFLLDTINQRLLTSFLCLVSMRVELGSHGRMRAVSDEDRRHLMRFFEPPPVWKIWIGGFEHPLKNEYWHRYLGMDLGFTRTPYLGPENCNTQVTTIVAGKFCAHILYSTILPLFLNYRPALTQIWPEGQFAIDAHRLPTFTQSEAISQHEAIARHATQVPI